MVRIGIGFMGGIALLVIYGAIVASLIGVVLWQKATKSQGRQKFARFERGY